MRLTVKDKTNEIEPKDIYFIDEKTNDFSSINQHLANQKLGQLEDIMEKYGINSAEELEHIILNNATGEQSFKDYIKPYKDIEEEFEIDSIEDLRDRLTIYKFLANHEMSCVDVNAYNLMLEDLNKYHSIEEEIGIDSYHIMKAMLNGYYWKGVDGIIYHFPELDFIRKDTCNESPCRPNHYYWNHTGKYLEDYGKTWALTKEELL